VLILRVEQYIAMVDRKLKDEEIGRCASSARTIGFFEGLLVTPGVQARVLQQCRATSRVDSE
jgi:hypothetical protein